MRTTETSRTMSQGPEMARGQRIPAMIHQEWGREEWQFHNMGLRPEEIEFMRQMREKRQRGMHWKKQEMDFTSGAVV